jgi:hypothetical protein
MAAIRLRLDAPEQAVVCAALALYEQLLARCREVGGDAAETAAVMAPIAARVSHRLAIAMYAEPPEEVARRELALGDHYIYPAGVGR